jgi:hypothetical protein
VTACLCGCPRTDHEGGDGACACGCPVWRPCRLYSADDEAHDRVEHEGVAERLVAEHTLTSEVTVLDDGAAVWLALPQAVADGADLAWASEVDVGEEEG